MNTQEEYLQNLRELGEQLALARDWLLRSYHQCQPAGIKETYTPEEFDSFETLASRFARASDLLLQKIFRGIDIVELSEGGTLLDAIHRSEKRGLVDSVEQIRTIRELRNEVVHEYQPKHLPLFFDELLKETPGLLDLLERSIKYIKQLA